MISEERSVHSHRREAPRLAVLVNPAAGKGRGAAASEAAVKRLESLGAKVTVYVGAGRSETMKLAATALAEQPDAIVVVGGDGTFSAIADQIIRAKIPVALVPAGTGNDLARGIGLPRAALTSAEFAAELALNGTLRAIDAGEVVCPDGRAVYLTVAALGFDAKVNERTNRLSWPRGIARYYVALLIELIRLAPLRFRMSIDGAPTIVRTGLLIAIGNTSSYGGGMPICVQAVPDDGWLDITEVGSIGRFKLLRLFPLLLRGKHLSRPEVHTSRAKTVDISAPGLVVYADGERVGTESVSISVISEAIRIFVAKESK